jgi:quercetin dioxygenase-like cupin family protein
MTTDENLKHLRRITEKLTSPQEIMVKKGTSCESEIPLCVEGNATAFGILKEKDVGICKIFATKGTTYPVHKHNQREFFGVISGKMKIETEEETRIIHQYEGFELQPNIIHTCVMLEDTWTWVVTMPSAEEFPDV